MSEENVEIVRRQWEAWNERRDDDWVKAHHQDVVVVAPEGWPEGAVSEGIEAWTLQAKRLRDNWEEARTEIDEIRPIGADRVFARIRYVTRGSDADFSFDTSMAVVITLQDGRIKRAEFFWDAAAALDAAGISE